MAKLNNLVEGRVQALPDDDIGNEVIVGSFANAGGFGELGRSGVSAGKSR